MDGLSSVCHWISPLTPCHCCHWNMKHIFVYVSLSLGLSAWCFFLFVCREEDVSCCETLFFECCWNLSRLLGASTRKFTIDLFTVTTLRFLACACLQYSLMLALWGVQNRVSLFSAALSESLLRISVWTERFFFFSPNIYCKYQQ